MIDKAYLSDSTIGFVRADKIRESKEPGPEDFVAGLGGSGTLVSAGGIPRRDAPAFASAFARAHRGRTESARHTLSAPI